ncbi:hypothetical protein VB776_15895 [Arcicella sp. DC2W]|uniref:Uncharacterized protein n=1 Tax=Arcicella gelida TaxID=2984195 RepID=A0ABU5S7G0_9BACT|nr:hypothetical protein [Arcicella sp. DC2W]MEA5404416.1 hypothetical protein [Arcicella sp. DC2W]
MPKIKCNCGNIIGLGDIPSPNQWLVIADEEYDQLFNSELVSPDAVYSEMKIVVECKKCKRLMFYLNGFDEMPIIYSRETPI